MPPTPAISTYNYLRLGVLALVTLLGVSVAYEFFVNDTRLGSISAYYFTPARSVFVGTLIGVGVALVAIKGRERLLEDVMLNVAGMLAPVVALIPAAVAEGTIVNDDPVDCPGAKTSCVPTTFEPGITNGAWTLGIVGAVALVAVVVLAVKDGRVGWDTLQRKQATVGLTFATFVYVGFVVFDVGWHDTYVQWGHYVAAVPLFVALAYVAVSNALQPKAGARTSMMRGRSVDLRYALIAVVMILALLVAAVYFLATSGDPAGRWEYWVFAVELALLVPFAAFWMLQTAQWWHEGAPGL